MANELPTHCERCGERPTHVQLYPLVKVGDEFICSRHPDYPLKANQAPCVSECCRGPVIPRVTNDPILDGGE